MSINQIPSSRISPLLQQLQQAQATKASSASTFAEAILLATQNRENNKGVDTAAAASAAAELLNLEMMKSALSLGGESSLPAFAPLSIPLTVAMTNIQPERQNIDRNEATPVSQPAPAPAEIKAQRPVDNNVQNIVERASEKYGVDGALIKAVIKAESNFNPSAVSHAGAQGLMQLMPSTARGLGVRDSFNPEQNVMAGTRFLKDMLNRYHGNLDSALAAYNWGPGNVDRKGTSSLPQETREYLSKVKSYYNQFIG